MLQRPDRDTPGPDNVRPGLHAFGSDGGADRYDVAWWDPRQLALDVQRCTFRQSVEAGLQDCREGRTIPVAEVRRRLGLPT